MSLADEVTKVKEMQRTDPVAKEQWYAYCAEYGEGIRDPAKHDASFLGSFMTQFQNGARLENKETAQLIQMIKLGQKKSQEWKRTWEQYCTAHPLDGKFTFDPSKRDGLFIEGFFDFIGKMAQGMNPVGPPGGKGGKGNMMMAMMSMMGGKGMGEFGPPLKKGSGMGAMSGDPYKDDLVQKIKHFQRQSETNKAMWHGHCDQALGGVYDPNRHDSSNLLEFAKTHGLGAPSGTPTMGPSNPLVMKIKTFQKQSEQHKQQWHNYCDIHLGGKYDPARASEEALQAFINEHGHSMLTGL